MAYFNFIFGITDTTSAYRRGEQAVLSYYCNIALWIVYLNATAHS